MTFTVVGLILSNVSDVERTSYLLSVCNWNLLSYSFSFICVFFLHFNLPSQPCINLVTVFLFLRLGTNYILLEGHPSWVLPPRTAVIQVILSRTHLCVLYFLIFFLQGKLFPSPLVVLVFNSS